MSGLDGPKDPAAGGHATAPAMWLTGISPKKTEGVDVRNETTIDQMIAKAVGQDTPFPSLEVATEDFTGFVGACDVGYSCTYMNTISWQGPTTPLPMEINPRVVFERMFGGLARSKSGSSACARDAASSIRCRSRRRNCSRGSARATSRVSASIWITCARSSAASTGRSSRPARTSKVPEAPVGAPEVYEAHVGLMFDLMALAFQADITRVFTFMMARDLHNGTYPQVGVDEPHHGLSHHQNKPDKIAMLRRR